MPKAMLVADATMQYVLNVIYLINRLVMFYHVGMYRKLLPCLVISRIIMLLSLCTEHPEKPSRKIEKRGLNFRLELKKSWLP